MISYFFNCTSTTVSLQVTADGSINCANQPDEQEGVVAQLIFCEAVAAINLLCQGGNFVFKMFTAFEHQMISLMYLLACLFQEIQVVKPGRHQRSISRISKLKCFLCGARFESGMYLFVCCILLLFLFSLGQFEDILVNFWRYFIMDRHHKTIIDNTCLYT